MLLEQISNSLTTKINPLSLLNPVLHTDSYKLSHIFFEPEDTQYIYSNFTTRSSDYFKRNYPDSDGKVVVYGIQLFLIKEFVTNWTEGFFKRPKQEVMEELETILMPYIGMDMKKLQHFADLHDLGYLPLRVKSLKEGTVINTGIPSITFQNTHPAFSWLTNYVESVFSVEYWKITTSATVARELRKLVNKYWDETVVDHSFKTFAIHDFSYRGHDSTWSASAVGSAHLLAFSGTDNVPAVTLVRTLLGAAGDVASSVPASEHSVVTLGINYYDKDDKELGEYLTLEKVLTEQFPTGVVAYVADSYDYWRLLSVILPRLKHIIEKRDGKLVIRPDSGRPEEIVCGTSINHINVESLSDLTDDQLLNSTDKTIYLTESNTFIRFTSAFQKELMSMGLIYVKELLKEGYVQDLSNDGFLDILDIDTNSPEYKGSIEVLYNLFGGTVNSKGYKELPPYIGLIYGDGITYTKAKIIYEGLKAKGFSAANVVFGVGSFNYYLSNSRDSLSGAIKATAAVVDDVYIPIYKDPKTNSGGSSKKSAKGYLKVDYNEDNEIVLYDEVSKEEEKEGLLQTVFEDGKLYNFDTFSQIQTRLMSTLETEY